MEETDCKRALCNIDDDNLLASPWFTISSYSIIGNSKVKRLSGNESPTTSMKIVNLDQQESIKL